MPLVLYKTYSIPKQYTPEETVILKDLIDQFRLRAGDDIPEENILYQKAQRYKDNQILSFYNAALVDINGWGVPRTNYKLSELYKENRALLILGAIVTMLMREGIFQGANQIDFNDSGLSIGMYNKTGIYQSWWGSLLAQYNADKKVLKDSVIVKSPNAGFYGISSEFAYRFARRTHL